MGRSRIAVLALALFVLSACTWPQYAGNAGRTGYAPFESSITVANAGQAVVRWQGDQVGGDPVLANGMMYATAGSGFLYAYPLTPTAPCAGTPPTCRSSWFAHFVGGATSDPVVVGDTLYIAALGQSE